ncbi:MAG: peroxiredoxin [Flavobacteriaceae bacterium CG_4_8_14_3_um_filter_34_10]|nr:peroxiredoxin [Flavobacteriia bacterium]PIQ17992.1 MAG: peroxiredoxin [Flavobacteriaceae bacterium CG18_big_fil_WC_8_21_14_2_50_34_36]PIV50478.1 MAG: peroxiredoxin [Flavobacteriaceae bacterium CG02_land_8_20_14_3_00_34_13]PIX10524.1 MAG: peroxiredoxin [Flavobacteriaceae bacterium CG_4_8_14_3_um_filter_34_10]PIZ09118.1 MAG: peroxiredoxin [Flavobacteriaceae bacterium CG_4_10_14_0_8_um_filter_34_31]PJC06793.1 MAG: peroxiredoxin [Flavobacteriaceae bacterium CG_4_9_14_0_8_um_filter_34_30]
MKLQIGDSIPNFTLKDQNGNDFQIKKIIGKQALVIYFYPKNFTPGCVKEACEFRDQFEDFNDLGATVIGISSDTESSHAKFASKYNLPFILLSDKNGLISRKFGVKKNLLGLLPGRETYVVNKKGRLILIFNSMDASKHIQKALKILQSENS